MKYKFFVIFIAIVLFCLYLNRKNTIIYDKLPCINHDQLLFNKIYEMVDENFLNKEFYEVISDGNTVEGCYGAVVNYNKKLNILNIGRTRDGFSNRYLASKVDLKRIVLNKIAIDELQLYLKPDTANYLDTYVSFPSRIYDVMIIF